MNLGNWFILNETITNGMVYNTLNLVSLIAILFSISVIVTKNPIFSVLFLIGLFITIALYLMMLGINFIGLSYLLVYVGAVSILFLFILMLINIRISELATENNNSVSLAVIIIGFVSINEFFFKITEMPIMGPTVSGLHNEASNGETALGINSLPDTLVAIYSVWDEKLSETSHITTIGNIIYTNYPLWLLLTSIILLLAMVGAIIITIKQ
jgi:NADH-ubiquinone oxidoreductase chain 6